MDGFLSIFGIEQTNDNSNQEAKNNTANITSDGTQHRSSEDLISEDYETKMKGLKKKLKEIQTQQINNITQDPAKQNQNTSSTSQTKDNSSQKTKKMITSDGAQLRSSEDLISEDYERKMKGLKKELKEIQDQKEYEPTADRTVARKPAVCILTRYGIASGVAREHYGR